LLEREEISQMYQACVTVSTAARNFFCECLWQTSFLVLLSYFALINLHYGFFFLRGNACMIHAIGWIQYTANVMICCPGVLICSHVWDLTKIQIQGSTSQMLGIFTRLTHFTLVGRVFSRTGP
jgi:hypothetical protein